MSSLFFIAAAIFLLAPLLAHALQVCPVRAYWSYTVATPPPSTSPTRLVNDGSTIIDRTHERVTNGDTAIKTIPSLNDIDGQVANSATRKVQTLLERDTEAAAAVVRGWLQEEN